MKAGDTIYTIPFTACLAVEQWEVIEILHGTDFVACAPRGIVFSPYSQYERPLARAVLSRSSIFVTMHAALARVIEHTEARERDQVAALERTRETLAELRGMLEEAKR